MLDLPNARNLVAAFQVSPMGSSMDCRRATSTSTVTTTISVKGHSQELDSTTEQNLLATPDLVRAASKFKIVTCTSTSCSRRRKNLGLDSLATFSDLYTLSSQASAAAAPARSSDNGGCHAEPIIVVEEGPCLGACQMAPCVAVEHEDFVGSVALEGMTDREFMDRV